MVVRRKVPGRRLVGREKDVVAVGRLIAGGSRLVSVFGGAGIGKTRLALEVVTRISDSATAYCDLTTASSAMDIRFTLAEELGVPRSSAMASGNRLDATLSDALLDRGPLVVVFDNFDHLVAAVPETLGTWLGLVPEVQFVVTTRVRLRVEPEEVYELSPLTLPRAGDTPSEIRRSEAVQLFVDRTRALRGRYELKDSCAEWVGEIVRRTGGIPLAIEFAAGRMSHMGEQTLLRSLAPSITSLSSDRVDGPKHQSTLRTALEGSFKLLSEWERTLLSRTSVFRGGFGPEAAEAVLSLDEGEDIIPTLGSLRDQSLLTTSAPDDSGELRYDLLPAVRELAQEHLAADAEAASRVTELHGDYYTRRGLAWARALSETDDPEALRLLALERSNLLEAHRRAVARRDAETGLAAALALDPLLVLRSPRDLHVRVLEDALSLVGAAGSATAEVHCAVARAHLFAGNTNLAERHVGRGLARCDDEILRAKLTMLAGKVALGRGQVAIWKARLEEAVSIVEALDRRARNDVMRADALLELGAALSDISDQRAEVLLEEARRLFGRAGARHREGIALRYLAYQYAQSRSSDPVPACQQAIEVARAYGDAHLEAAARTHHGVALLDRGSPELAREHFQVAEAMFRRIGARYPSVINWCNIALARCDEGDYEVSRGLLMDAVDAYADLGDARGRAWALATRAGIEALAGDPERSESLLEEAEQWLDPELDPVMHATLQIYRACAERANMRVAEAAGNLDAAGVHRERARLYMNAVVAGGMLDRSVVARSAHRRFLQCCGDVARDSDVLPRASGPSLRLLSRGQLLELPTGERVDLRRRGAIRRILLRLVEAHRSDPCRGVPAEMLFEAGWPGEHILQSAAMTRVYWAVRTLRQLGLDGVLLRQDDGYILVRDVQIFEGPGVPRPHGLSRRISPARSSPRAGAEPQVRSTRG